MNYGDSLMGMSKKINIEKILSTEKFQNLCKNDEKINIEKIISLEEIQRVIVGDEMKKFIPQENYDYVNVEELLKDSRVQRALVDTDESTAFSNLMCLWCVDGVSSREICELVMHGDVFPSFEELETFKRINGPRKVRKL